MKLVFDWDKLVLEFIATAKVAAFATNSSIQRHVCQENVAEITCQNTTQNERDHF